MCHDLATTNFSLGHNVSDANARNNSITAQWAKTPLNHQRAAPLLSRMLDPFELRHAALLGSE